MPPPMTSSRSGMPSTSSAPVESMIRSSSGRNGSEAASEPDGDDAVLEADDGVADLDRVRAGELAGAAHDLDLALLGQRLQAAGEPADDAVLELADLVDVDLRRLEGDAGLAELGGLGHHLGDVQQRLGRDAADVQADAAELLAAVDQGDAQPEIGGAEGGRVAARAAAEHGDLDLDVGVRGRPPAAPRPRPSAPPTSSAGASVAGLASSGASAPSSESSTEPSATLSPTATVMSVTLPARGRRDLHRRLVGLEHDQRVLDRDLVADGDEDLDDGYLVEIPDVRDLDLHQSSTLRRSDSWLTRCATKRAASAPSITRWS